MASTHWAPDGMDSFGIMRRALLNYGDWVAPRGEETLELRNVTITVEQSHYPLMTLLTNRRMNQRLAAAEALQLIGGCSDAALMRKVAPNMVAFQDGGYFHGAYGPRLRGQMPKIVERLVADPDTRQAVATIWDPLHDLHTAGMHDYPCTVYLSWVIRDGKLEQTTHMRSNDLWWGWTYDLVQFTSLQQTLANVLGVPAGLYHHMVDSFHMYRRDMDKINECEQPDGSWSQTKLRGLAPTEDGGWQDVAQKARELLHNPLDVDEPSWYRDQMIKEHQR